MVGRVESRRRSRTHRKDAHPRTLGAGNDRHWRAAARSARHDHGHDAKLQRDRRVEPCRSDPGNCRRRAGADRDRARAADRGDGAIRIQSFLPDAIARARHDGASRLAPSRSYPPRPGRRRVARRPAPSGCGGKCSAAMKIRRARNFRHGRIEIIPMIDVMFFLLVTFMLASLSMQSLNSITVNLPQGDAPNLQHKEPVALTITKDSKIFLDKTPTTLATMAFTLKTMLQGGPDQGVVVNADGAAPEGTVVEAMLQARRAGVEHFLIAVKRE